MPIMDCDETFNYWEAVHFLLYGNGFQTWEYSNQFALRTYSYLLPLVGLARWVITPLLFLSEGLPPWFWNLLTEQEPFTPSGTANGENAVLVLQEKVAVFVLLRVSLGVWMACAEISFAKAIYQQGLGLRNSNDSNSNNRNQQISYQGIGNTDVSSASAFRLLTCTSLVTEVLLLSSAGLAHSASALLPSSTVMGLWLYAAAAFLRHHHLWFVVLAVLATLAVGWPFGVLVFVPMGLAILVRSYQKNRLTSFLIQILIIATLIQGSVMAIDYYHYGRIVSPILNILIYNTHAGGDELYGVEPLSYYIKNLLLNFNYVAPVGLVGAIVPLLTWMRWWKDGWALILPLYLWIAIVAPRPHKEERFLFPIYPCICLSAAMGTVAIIDAVSRWMMRKNSKQRALSIGSTLIVQSFIWGPAVILSWCRTIALSKYYVAPLLLYAQLHSVVQSNWGGTSPAVVCTCGEWYRFPSHFYIPSNISPIETTIREFGFAPSTFQGQLPQSFTIHGSGPLSASVLSFNDKNKPEEDSYIPLVDCDYLVDLHSEHSDHSTSCIDPFIGGDRLPEWNPIAGVPFLDADRTSALHRVLYIPYFHERARQSSDLITFIEFTLYAKMKAPDTNAEEDDVPPNIADEETEQVPFKNVHEKDHETQPILADDKHVAPSMNRVEEDGEALGNGADNDDEQELKPTINPIDEGEIEDFMPPENTEANEGDEEDEDMLSWSEEDVEVEGLQSVEVPSQSTDEEVAENDSLPRNGRGEGDIEDETASAHDEEEELEELPPAFADDEEETPSMNSDKEVEMPHVSANDGDGEASPQPEDEGGEEEESPMNEP
jgi:alpha-1,2-mannosyltransferase